MTTSVLEAGFGNQKTKFSVELSRTQVEYIINVKFTLIFLSEFRTPGANYLPVFKSYYFYLCHELLPAC